MRHCRQAHSVTNWGMSEKEIQFRVRVPEDIHAKLSNIAEKNQRSINAEIVSRLRGSLRWDSHDPDEVALFLHSIDRRVDKLEFEVSRALSSLGLQEMPAFSIQHTAKETKVVQKSRKKK